MTRGGMGTSSGELGQGESSNHHMGEGQQPQGEEDLI